MEDRVRETGYTTQESEDDDGADEEGYDGRFSEHRCLCPQTKLYYVLLLGVRSQADEKVVS